MTYDRYRYEGKTPFSLDTIQPNDKQGLKNKDEGVALLEKNKAEIFSLQEALYAEGKQSLLVIFQAMDAAGKDGTINHVFSGVNPQGITVSSFKQPSGEDLAHDFLWRVHKEAPARGYIGIFNRSHYEDVLVGRVLNLPSKQPLPQRALDGIWKNRYRQIRDFERALYENGTTIVKFYLHVSKEEQHERFVARIDDPSKQWKFSIGDVETSKKWDAYMDAYTKAIEETAAPHAPWYIIPADRKWYARAVVSQVVLDTLRSMQPEYPAVTKEGIAEMEAYKQGAT